MQEKHVHISRGVSKLGANIPSISMPPVITCRSDAPCFKKCYARRGRFAFQKNKDLLQMNLDIWNENPEIFEQAIISAAYFSKYFRYFSSGDIPDASFIAMMVRVAKCCPATSFLCFTKKYELVDEYVKANGELPDNLSIVYSAWGDFKPENPFGFPVAYIRFKNVEVNIPENARACSGYCGDCVQTGESCWTLKRKCGDAVVFNEH